MKLIAVNGSPRKHWNTAQLLEKVVAGAQSAGMETKLVHLYDYDYKGCSSCFACKLIGGNSYGRCAMRDSITPLLDEIHQTDALILGSPLYLMAETGEMRSFMERVCFPYIRYSDPPASLYPRKIKTAVLYTMNMDEKLAQVMGFDSHVEKTKFFMSMTFGECNIFNSYDTFQFSDYAKYDNTRFDVDVKKQRRNEIFPQDLLRAYELGKSLAENCSQ